MMATTTMPATRDLSVCDDDIVWVHYQKNKKKDAIVSAIFEAPSIWYMVYIGCTGIVSKTHYS
jgi:hypothetical protein